MQLYKYLSIENLGIQIGGIYAQMHIHADTKIGCINISDANTAIRSLEK